MSKENMGGLIEELGRQRDKLAKDRKGFSRWTEDPDTGT
jgi:hypothetical protein